MISLALPGLSPFAGRDQGRRRCAAGPRLLSRRPPGTPRFETVSTDQCLGLKLISALENGEDQVEFATLLLQLLEDVIVQA